MTVEAYLRSGALRGEAQLHTDTEILWTVLRVDRPIDPAWSGVTGDIAHNLRSALDYLVYQLFVLENGAPPPANGKQQFPIFKDRDGFRSRGVKQNLRGLSAPAVEMMESFQPFATGEGEASPLWQLRQLSNRDKHHDIHLTIASASRIVSEAVFTGGPEPLMVCVGQTGPVADQALLFGRKIPAGNAPPQERAAGLKVDGDARLHITFLKPAIDFQRGVEGILAAIGKRVMDIADRVNSQFFSKPV